MDISLTNQLADKVYLPINCPRVTPSSLCNPSKGNADNLWLSYTYVPCCVCKNFLKYRPITFRELVSLRDVQQGRPSPNATLPPPPFTWVSGYNPRKICVIKDARMRVLEHFGPKNQHLYEPGLLTVSCNFQISRKCARRSPHCVKTKSCNPALSVC